LEGVDVTDLTRRDVMRLAAIGGLGAMMGRDAQAKAPAVLGVQLYTVRKQIDTDPEATLKAIADIGYKEVEVLRGTLSRVGPAARKVGLSPVSVHVETPLITGNWEAWKFMRGAVPESYDLAALINEAKTHGVKYLVLPYLMAGKRGGGLEFYTKLADRLNVVGEQVTKAGLEFCYHNHGFEFEPLADGRRPLDVLMAATRPELVKLELDVFWVSLTGADPAAILKQYSGRVPLLHLKDKAKGAAPETQESKVPPTTFKPLGAGAVDIPAILAAASAAGVKHYFVEQDQSEGDPLDALRTSFRYVQGLS
jgi:sugar phosphate isomerase/epimerase